MLQNQLVEGSEVLITVRDEHLPLSEHWQQLDVEMDDHFSVLPPDASDDASKAAAGDCWLIRTPRIFYYLVDCLCSGDGESVKILGESEADLEQICGSDRSNLFFEAHCR